MLPLSEPRDVCPAMRTRGVFLLAMLLVLKNGYWIESCSNGFVVLKSLFCNMGTDLRDGELRQRG
jgi:hypothetical protein